jgi:hypothetical protein
MLFDSQIFAYLQLKKIIMSFFVIKVGKQNNEIASLKDLKLVCWTYISKHQQCDQLIITEAGLLSKSSRSAGAIGVTKFITIILTVTLFLSRISQRGHSTNRLGRSKLRMKSDPILPFHFQAVCKNCGCMSPDFNRCERCKKPIGEDCKTVSDSSFNKVWYDTIFSSSM